MFKKLKEKIAEEVKPLKISQFAQSVVAPGNSAVVESPPNEHFSLDDEPPEDLFGNEGFSVVDLHHPSLPIPLSSGRFSRQSSMSSLASDTSAFLPIHDASIGAFNMQDLESASEREEVLPQMNNVSKQELCNSYLKLYRHYQKYKGRATDLKNFCRELEKDNKKHKTVLLECQEKSLRRIAELKEQCALEQHAKAHLEEALRNDLEEKDHLIQTLQTKIKLLKDAHSGTSSALIRVEDENLLFLPGGIGEDSKANFSVKDDIPRHQELRIKGLCDMKLDNSFEENDVLALKNKFENLKAKLLKESSVHIPDVTVNVEFQDLLNEISEWLTKKLTPLSLHLNEHISYSREEVDKNLCFSENYEKPSNLLLDQLEQNLSDSVSHNINSNQHSTTALEKIPLNTKNLFHILDQGTDREIEGSTDVGSMDHLPELTNELTDLQNRFEKVTQELKESHQLISEQNSTITKLNEKLATLQGELDIYNEQEHNETINSELTQTKQELDGVQQKLLVTQQAIKEKDHIIKKTNKNMNENLETLKSELLQTKQELENVQQLVGLAQKTIDEKDQIINETKKKMNENVETIKSELMQTKEELDVAQQTIHGKENDIKKIKDALKKNDHELDEVLNQKTELTNLLTTVQSELAKTNSLTEELTHKMLNADREIFKRESIIDHLNKKIEKLQKEFESVESDSNKRNEIISCLEVALSEMKQKFDQISHELELQSKLCDEKDRLTELVNKDVSHLQEELNYSKAQSEQLTQKLHNASTSLDEKNSEIVNLRQDLESMKREMETASSQNMEGSQTIKVLENDLTVTKGQLNKVLEEIKEFKKLIQEKDLTITSINDELAAIHKNLEITLAQKTEVCEKRMYLEDELAVVNRSVELLTEDLKSARNFMEEKDSNYAEMCEKLSDIHKELDATKLEKAKVEDNVADLEKELSNISADCKKLTEELECSSKLLEEKDFKIAFLTEDVATVHDTLNKMSTEKEEFNEKLSSLKKELTTTKLQFEQVSQEMQSAYHASREKDLTIAHITEKLENSKKDLDIMSCQKSEACGLVKDLQNELEEVSIKFQHVSKEFQDIQESVVSKDLIIANLTTDLMTTRNELASTLALKDESYELVTHLQKELKDSELGCEKVSEELQSTLQLLEKKDLYIEQLKMDLVKIKDEFNKTSILNSEANKNVETLQSVLEETKNVSEQICSKSTNQLFRKKLKSHITKTVVDEEEVNSSMLIDDTPELVLMLQNKLKDNEKELENINTKLQNSKKSVDERNIVIKKLEGELAVIKKKLRTSDVEDEIDHITRNKSENPFILENLGHIIENNLGNNKFESHTRTMSCGGDACVDSSELCTKDESGSKIKSDKCVVCVNEQEQSRLQRQKHSINESSLSHIHTEKALAQENTAVSSEPGNPSTSTSEIANRVESTLVSENHSVSETIWSLEEPSRLSGEVIDNPIRHKKPVASDLELSSGIDADIPVETKSISRNAQEALLRTDQKNKPQEMEFEFSSIQNILDEIQKENKEYGSLLDCHKNIINHLEGISKMSPEEINPGSAEWLHQQLIILSQKLYDTKEKQSMQIASINRLVKHQQHLMKSDDNESKTIEMQYLRNIVFQYMIGKETMLLAKVISAVMKFDPQQMDQVMQKELQKQTLLGQLGLL